MSTKRNLSRRPAAAASDSAAAAAPPQPQPQAAPQPQPHSSAVRQAQVQRGEAASGAPQQQRAQALLALWTQEALLARQAAQQALAEARALWLEDLSCGAGGADVDD